MKIKLYPAALALLALVGVSACGRGDDDDTSAATAPAAAAPSTTSAPSSTAAATTDAPAGGGALAAKVGESDLGKLMTDAEGMTLYGFVNDVDALSTCYSTCAEAWPPVIVDAEWSVGPGLDTGVFSTTERDDGTLQLVAGKFPLYTYGGDAQPGDVTGQGSGDVWFAMALDGTLIEGEAAVADEAPATTAPADTTDAAEDDPYADDQEAAPATTAPADVAPIVAVAATDLGDVVVDAAGLTLYGFTEDTEGTPTCEGACAEAWPPVVVDGTDLPAGLDPAVFSVVERPDGSMQLKAGAWPLYRFAGDAAPGDVNGQGSGDVWFVVAPDGSLIK